MTMLYITVAWSIALLTGQGLKLVKAGIPSREQEESYGIPRPFYGSLVMLTIGAMPLRMPASLHR